MGSKLLLLAFNMKGIGVSLHRVSVACQEVESGSKAVKKRWLFLMGNNLVKGKVPVKPGVTPIPVGQALDKLPQKFLKILFVLCLQQKEEELDLSDCVILLGQVLQLRLRVKRQVSIYIFWWSTCIHVS